MAKFSNWSSIGQQKEQQAKLWLQRKHIQIIADNFRCKGGEIDLIGLSNDELIFFEVKYRKQNNYGHPAEFVTASKQQKLIHAAQTYLLKHPQYQNHAMRFDVITFEGEDTEPNWIENAFGV